MKRPWVVHLHYEGMRGKRESFFIATYQTREAAEASRLLKHYMKLYHKTECSIVDRGSKPPWVNTRPWRLEARADFGWFCEATFPSEERLLRSKSLERVLSGRSLHYGIVDGARIVNRVFHSCDVVTRENLHQYTECEIPL